MTSKFVRMANTLPSFYRAEVNSIIRGLLLSWAVGDDDVEIQIQNTKDQIFVETGNGKYLDFLGNNVGVPRDPHLGIFDDDFRNLIPVLSFYPKQVRKTIIALLDVFWGPGFTRPNINSGNVEKFNFGPESLLTGTVNFIKGNNAVIGVGTLFTLELNPGDYIKASTLSGYTYQKVSAIHSDTSLELADPWKSAVSIGALVSKGIVRELNYTTDNGVARNLRLKPFAFDNINQVSVSELVKFINTDNEHSQYLTASAFLDPIAGNKLNLRTNTAGLLGSIQINGGDANDSLRLNFLTTRQSQTKCSVFEINPNEIVVRIPSSVPILRRTLKGSSHPKGTKTEIYSNKEFFNFSSLGASSTLTLTVDSNPYTVTFTNSSAFVDPSKATAIEVAQVINSQLTFLEAFTGSPSGYGKVGLRTTDGSSEYQITGGTANSLLGLNTSLQSDPDLIQADYPSSYLFDPTGQLFTVTGINASLTTLVGEGAISATLSLDNASNFPNKPGKFLIDFGRSEQEGPIGYNSRPNNSTLLIDASHIFQSEHHVGRKVNFISDSPSIPRVTGSDYPVYVVGTQESRIAAQKLIKQLLASGVVIRFVIDFPEVLFECVCQSCGPTEAPDYRGPLSGSGPLVF